MKEAIQESASEAGHITKSKMLEILDSHSRTLQTNIKGHIEDIITTHLSRFSPRVEGVTDIQQTETEDTTARETYKSYCHSGKLGLHTCLGWDFPVCSLKPGWRFWHMGQPHYDRLTRNNEAILCLMNQYWS